MKAFVFTEIKDDSISGDKIHGGAISGLTGLEAANVDIDGGTIDGVSIGASSAASLVRASNYISIHNGVQSLAVMSTIGIVLYQNGVLTPKVLISNGASTTSYLDLYKIIFGADSASPGVTQKFQFYGTSYFSGLMQANADMKLVSPARTYNSIGEMIDLFYAMYVGGGNSWTPWSNFTAINAATGSSLAAMNGYPISATQWGYVSQMNQPVSTSNTPTFNGLSANGGNITNVLGLTATGDIDTSGDINCQDLSASALVSAPEVHSDEENYNSNGLITSVTKYPQDLSGNSWGASSIWKSSSIEKNPHYSMDGISGVNSTDIRTYEFWAVMNKTVGSTPGGVTRSIYFNDFLGSSLADLNDEIIDIEIEAMQKWSTTALSYRFCWRFQRSTSLTARYAIVGSGSGLSLSADGIFNSTSVGSATGQKVSLGLDCHITTAQPYLILYNSTSTYDAVKMFLHGNITIFNT